MTSIHSKIIKNLGDYLQFENTQTIAAPLEMLGIVGFIYTRRYPNNTYINFATHINSSTVYFNKFYKNEYSIQDMQNHIFVEHGLILTELSPSNMIWKDGRDLHGHGNGVTLIEKSQDYTESYTYFSDMNNYQMNVFYLSNVHLLKQFSHYFREKAQTLILNAEKRYRLTIPDEYIIFQNDLTKKPPTIDIEGFSKSIAGNGISLGKEYNYNKVSLKEADCLFWMLQGKSIPEIAVILNKSSKTVEKQVNNLKKKFCSYHTNQLIQAATKSGVADFLNEVMEVNK